MTIVELLPQLRALPRGEKLRVVQFLIDEIAREEELQPFVAGAVYPVWSPHYASDAAAALQDMLGREKEGSMADATQFPYTVTIQTETRA